MVEELFPRVGWITPNVDELAVLSQAGSIHREGIPEAAARLREADPGLNILVTGGHLERPDDYLLLSSGESFWVEGEWVRTNATHGTGCALSSALLCGLIAGKNPQDAVFAAKAWVTQALKEAYPVGRGRGPMNHLFQLDHQAGCASISARESI